MRQFDTGGVFGLVCLNFVDEQLPVVEELFGAAVAAVNLFGGLEYLGCAAVVALENHGWYLVVYAGAEQS